MDNGIKGPIRTIHQGEEVLSVGEFSRRGKEIAEADILYQKSTFLNPSGRDITPSLESRGTDNSKTPIIESQPVRARGKSGGGKFGESGYQH